MSLFPRCSYEWFHSNGGLFSLVSAVQIDMMSAPQTIEQIEALVWATAVPNDRNDNSWGTLSTDVGLTGPELSLLKNYRFPKPAADVSSTRGTAIKTGEVNWGLFQIADNRIRAECEISFGNKSFMADVMCDGGAQSELTLPGRKIVQLGLEPFLTTISRGSTNDKRVSLKFKPVQVKLRFTRATDSEAEERIAFLTVSCHKDEYERCMQESGTKEELQVTPTLTGKRKLWDGSDASDIKEVKLSPVAHHPPERQEERVVLGAGGLSRLKVHGNFEKQVLEIEEDVEYEG